WNTQTHAVHAHAPADMFGFGTLLYVIILLLNAVAILNEERFLARIGWARNSAELYGDTESVKAKLINLISAVRTLMRIPLIIVNVVVIAYALVLG
ncbi:hypothetical protein GGI11_005892, partial [Coemansia sp. RSA 2049]